jgi:signal transduction histidine kinase
VPVEHDGQPVAALVVDATLAEDPELVRAAASATLVAVENGALEGALRDAERRAREAIGRDLHDGTQQRLVALRIHLALLDERLGRPEEHALVERLGHELDLTIDELRDIAGGRRPPLLASRGVPAALEAVAGRTPVRVSIYDDGFGRPPEAVETTIYFCCLESLQNAAKHAGPDALVSIHLERSDGGVRFSIEDDGPGFDPASVTRGSGLENLAGRVAALGGQLQIEAGEGRGTRVVGVVPV